MAKPIVRKPAGKIPNKPKDDKDSRPLVHISNDTIDALNVASAALVAFFEMLEDGQADLVRPHFESLEEIVRTLNANYNAATQGGAK